MVIHEPLVPNGSPACAVMAETRARRPVQARRDPVSGVPVRIPVIPAHDLAPQRAWNLARAVTFLVRPDPAAAPGRCC